MVSPEGSSQLRFAQKPTATTGTVRDRTGRDKRCWMGGRSVRVVVPARIFRGIKGERPALRLCTSSVSSPRELAGDPVSLNTTHANVDVSDEPPTSTLATFESPWEMWRHRWVACWLLPGSGIFDVFGANMGSNQGMWIRWSGLTIDCVNPVRLAGFWGTLLDREASPGLPGWVELASRHEHEPRINFQPVPEPKVGKVRIHMDIAVDDIDAGVERVIDLGGSHTGERHDYPEGVVVVLADPEDNEFCAVQYFQSLPRSL